MTATTDTHAPSGLSWRVLTYRQHEVRSGIYWEAMLMFGSWRIGTVVQHGTGGADEVEITHPAARALWRRYVDLEHGGSQEAATYALMIAEDSAL